MANPERGEVRLDVGGTGYLLKLTLSNIVAIQRQTKRPMGQIVAAIQELDVEMIAFLVWAALQPNHSRRFKTVEDVLDLMEKAGGLDQLGLFVTAIAEVVKSNRSAVTDQDEANPRTAGGTVANSTSEPELVPA